MSRQLLRTRRMWQPQHVRTQRLILPNVRHATFRHFAYYRPIITRTQIRRFCTSEDEIAKEAAKKARMQKMSARKASLQEESEIDLVSGTGLLVMGIAALMFYGIFKIDQEKNKGFDSSVTGLFQSIFGASDTMEDFLNKYEKYGKPEQLPDDWGWFSIIFDHLKNIVTLTGNWEGLYSKLFRCVAMPEKSLLPPVRDMGNQRTLIVDLDTVIHSTWSRKDLYERHSRPHWKKFLRRMASCGWEVIMFSSDEQMDWEENPAHVAVIDDKGYINGLLWGKDMYYFNGHKCKDISRMNRRPNRVVLLDSKPKNVQLFPENAVLLTPWRGENPDDTELEDIGLFLEYLQKADVADVRSVIEDYRGLHIPSAFREAYIEQLNSR